MSTIPPPPLDTDRLRRDAFGIQPVRVREHVMAAADEVDVLRSALRSLLGPDTYDVVQRRAEARYLTGAELGAIRRAIIDPKARP